MCMRAGKVSCAIVTDLSETLLLENVISAKLSFADSVMNFYRPYKAENMKLYCYNRRYTIRKIIHVSNLCSQKRS